MRWSFALLLAWATLWIASEVPRVTPASWWFEAGDVEVHTPNDGVCPLMQFERRIRRDFHGSWVVTLMRQSPSGFFYTFRRPWYGSNDYRPGNGLPDPLDLCWWTGARSLELPNGFYKIHTLWRIRVGPDYKEVRRTSNTFEVRNPT